MSKLRNISKNVVIGYGFLAAVATTGYIAYEAYKYWSGEIMPNPIEHLQTDADAGIESRLVTPPIEVIRTYQLESTLEYSNPDHSANVCKDFVEHCDGQSTIYFHKT